MKNLRYAGFFAVTFIAVFSVLLLFQSKGPTLNTEKKAPDFTITTFEGKKITLSKLPKDKVIVVNFWASWCGPCREEAPELEKVWRQYKGRIYFIGLNWKDDKKDALAFMKEFKVSYPNGPVENKVATEYGITGIPETYVIKKGYIQEHIIGATTFEALSQAIEKVL